MNAVRVASVGLGWWGQVLADRAGNAGLQIVSCFARSDHARDDFGSKNHCRQADSLDAVLADPEVEAVLVATPHSTHAGIVEAAATAGKHVFVEKPFTLTVAEGRRAVTAAEQAGVVLQVGHNRRRQPATRRLKDLVGSGALGVVHHLEANLSKPSGLDPRTGWRGDPAESPAGGMTGLGVHMADNLIYLAGRPSRLAAFSRRHLGLGMLDDVTSVTIEFESGALGVLSTSMVVPDVARTAVHGTEAAAWNEVDGARFYFQVVGEKERSEQQVETLDTIEDELTEFAACVRGDATPETDGRAALEVVAVLEGIVESVTTARVVDLDEIRARK
ncbi:MAG: gfo/Idh/MocA family oxidoreductase [Streptosporangiales bacterium]|nr:gfo/Idh/MocA family oxidoreductase [Streptosporangiales bacterium]